MNYKKQLTLLGMVIIFIASHLFNVWVSRLYFDNQVKQARIEAILSENENLTQEKLDLIVAKQIVEESKTSGPLQTK